MARKLITQFLGSVFGRGSTKQPASQVTTTIQSGGFPEVDTKAIAPGPQKKPNLLASLPTKNIAFYAPEAMDLPTPEEVAAELGQALREQEILDNASVSNSPYVVQIEEDGCYFLSVADANDDLLPDKDVEPRRCAVALHALSGLFASYPALRFALPEQFRDEKIEITASLLGEILLSESTMRNLDRAIAVLAEDHLDSRGLDALFEVAVDAISWAVPSGPASARTEKRERVRALLAGEIGSVTFLMPDGSDLIEAARAPAQVPKPEASKVLQNPAAIDARGATWDALHRAGLLPREDLGVDPTAGMHHDTGDDEPFVIKVRNREGACIPKNLDAADTWAFRLAVAIHVFDAMSGLKDTEDQPPTERDLPSVGALLRYKHKRIHACQVLSMVELGDLPDDVSGGWTSLCTQAIETLGGLDKFEPDEVSDIVRAACGLLNTSMRRTMFRYGSQSFYSYCPKLSEPIEEPAPASKTARAQYAELYHRVIGNSAGKMRVEPLPSVRNGVIVLPHLNDSESRRKKDVLDQWKPLVGATLPLVPTPDLADVCRRMDEEFPHAAQLTRKILREVGRADTVRFKPILLTGKPGIAKSTYARKLAEFLGLPSMLISCGGTADGSFGGTSAQWSTARCSLPLQTIKEKRCASPMLILDEVEKASQEGHNGTLVDVLLTYLEPSTAKALTDPALESQVDVSRCLYIATANYPDRIPGPLYSRFQVLEMPSPKREHAPQLARCLLRSIAEDRGLPEEAVEPLTIEEIEWISDNWKGGNIRHLRRWVEGALDARDEVLASRPLH